MHSSRRSTTASWASRRRPTSGRVSRRRSITAKSAASSTARLERGMRTAALGRAADALDWFIDRIGRITGWCSLAIVLVMAFNVLLRYLFRTGSVAMQELEWHLMAPICMLGLSYAILKDGHVQVDILYGRMPERAKRVIDFISTVLVVAVVFILLKLSIPYVEQSYRIGERSPDPGGL